MTHIENIPHILANGITHFSSPKANSTYLPIGDSSLISRRAATIMPNGKLLGQYIPFYFGAHMPMLYVIQKGLNGVPSISAEKIVYCISSVAQIIHYKLEFVFTDGHAVDEFTSFYSVSDIHEIENLIDKKAISSKYWKDPNDLDLKRRKEAEFLLANDIPKEAVIGFVVSNELAKSNLIAFGIPDSKIVIKANFYF